MNLQHYTYLRDGIIGAILIWAVAATIGCIKQSHDINDVQSTLDSVAIKLHQADSINTSNEDATRELWDARECILEASSGKYNCNITGCMAKVLNIRNWSHTDSIMAAKRAMIP